MATKEGNQTAVGEGEEEEEEATGDDIVGDNAKALIFHCGAVVNHQKVLWRAWSQVCDCYHFPPLTREVFTANVIDSLLPARGIIKKLIETSPPARTHLDENDVHRTFVKFYERALVDGGRDIVPVEAVCALAEKYHKVLPMAIVSNEKVEDVIQLLAKIGVLHLFDVVIAEEDGKSLSEVELFAQAAKRLRQYENQCLGIDDRKPNISLQREQGRTMLDVRTLPSYSMSSCYAPCLPSRSCSEKGCPLFVPTMFIVCVSFMALCVNNNIHVRLANVVMNSVLWL